MKIRITGFIVLLTFATSSQAALPPKAPCDQAVEDIAKLNIKNLPGELRRKLSELGAKVQSLKTLKNNTQCQKEWAEFLKANQNQLKPIDPQLYTAQPVPGTKAGF